jgi:hypothetical protein
MSAGALVASSAGDALFVDVGGGRTERRSPSESSNALIRASFSALQALQALQAQRRSDVVASSQAVLRTTASGETMLMVQRPFGESLGLRWTLVVAAPESDFTAGLMHARSVSLALIGALVLLGTLLAWLIARGIGQRLNRLSEAAGQLGRGEVPVIDHRTHIREVRALSQVLHDSARAAAGLSRAGSIRCIGPCRRPTTHWKPARCATHSGTERFARRGAGGGQGQGRLPGDHEP